MVNKNMLLVIVLCFQLSLYYLEAFDATPLGRNLLNHPSKSNALKLGSASNEDGTIISRISYRPPTLEEIPACFAIESASYPVDEAASLEGLTYRLTNAGDHFQCAILHDDEDNTEKIIGFVCGTRCDHFEEESMSTHTPAGPYLAIHSVVVDQDYRRQGIATAMLQKYMDLTTQQKLEQQTHQENGLDTITSVVLLAKAGLLGFYVNCGFQVNRPSPIVHGQELWYDLEQQLVPIQSLPQEGESWFVKTETFKRPFPEVKPHLEAHKKWVQGLRTRAHDPICITSGYRVDADGKPGGGGLMFVSAKTYEEAHALVLRDPLVANDCVDWQLNGWIGQVGDVEMR